MRAHRGSLATTAWFCLWCSSWIMVMFVLIAWVREIIIKPLAAYLLRVLSSHCRWQGSRPTRFPKTSSGPASGPHVSDVICSLGALSPGDPISQGVLNGILKNKGSWGSVDRALESGPNWIATTGVV